MKEIKNIEELSQFHKEDYFGNGTYNTGKHALEQRTPLFIAFPDDKVNWKKFVEDLENG